jgi:twitching motility protein PilU
VIREFARKPRGIVLVTGPTGSGKSTTLASIINEINETRDEHIMTIEDPIEFLHRHKKCIVNQRELGGDAQSFSLALKAALRQDPDVILIGEIRDRETMEYGVQFAETGHLVLATLHANSSNQALDRIINFFPEEKREQLLMDLSLNIRSMISQRLVPREKTEGRIAAMEILIGTPLVADLIFRGEVSKIKEVMARSNRLGMKTFDQALFDLYEAGVISYEEGLRNADSKNELRLRIKLESKREDRLQAEASSTLRIVDDSNDGKVY